MKINNITLENFSSFEGITFLDFESGNTQKSIILIGGKNGAGKTSLFTALKIALYGPLAYGYIGMNPHYISKIKECINTKAFQKEKVEAGVSIEVSFLIGREMKVYRITREWDYTNKKLNEIFWVESNGERLNNTQESYFVNYMQSMIPPELFEFFMFDGEEVGNIFSTTAYNSYIKNAVYTLCGMDIFDILRKNTSNYVGKALSHRDNEERKALESIKGLMEKKVAQREVLVSKRDEGKERLEKISLELIELENKFKKAGGLTKDQRKKLEMEQIEAERNKIENSTRIRWFVEELMPFYIVKEFTSSIIQQLQLEEKSDIFFFVQHKINGDILRNKLKQEKISDSTIELLQKKLIEIFKPDDLVDEFVPIHGLSKEDTGRVNMVVSQIDSFNRDGMINTIRSRTASLEKTMEINKVLKEAISDVDEIRYTEKQQALLQEREQVQAEIVEEEQEIDDIDESLKDLDQQCEKLRQLIREKAQNKHAYDLANKISKIMETVLEEKAFFLRARLESLIVKNLKHIYRKNNLITHIEIDEGFRFSLYQEATYSYSDIAYLIKNLGAKEFEDLIGKSGKERVLKEAETTKIVQALFYFEQNDSEKLIKLYKKIELERLSKGERQIFILALYWSIIELSGKDIPFIIDTPYARIDANHRKEISEKFFPYISKQVIILSTDEEINAEYYSIIKPYVAKEYLLKNDESQNRTLVENHYFFEV